MRRREFSVNDAGLLTTFMAIGVLMLAASAQVFGQVEGAIYRFKGGNDGSSPLATMVADPAGNLYGTTFQGGGSANCGVVNKTVFFGCGTVFRLTRPAASGQPWSEAVLYSFTKGGDGALPAGGVVLDQAGNLYGTTSEGGTLLNGTVFQLTPPATQGGAWTESTIYNFPVSINGYGTPHYLIFDKSGNLYGYNGGSFGGVFQLAPPATQGGTWTYTQIYSFNGGTNDGSSPVGGLLLDAAGNFYGTTILGGNSACAGGCGVVFKLERPVTQGGSWTESVLYSFKGIPDGNYPFDGLMMGNDGNLYGTTSRGGQNGALYGGYGTVFELARPTQSGGAWTEVVLYSFQNNGDGAGPLAGLIHDNAGNLYGTATPTVFRLTPPSSQGGPWAETTLQNFNSVAGVGLFDAGLTLRPKLGILYGVTQGGGICNRHFCNGTVFRIRP